LAERIHGIAGRREADAAAQADPLQALQNGAIALFGLRQQFVEARKIVVLAIVVDHYAVQLIDDLQNAFRVAFAQAAVGASRVGQVETRATDARIQAQAHRLALGERSKALELV